MIGNPASIASILNASSAYRIPPYQRAYQWEADRWHGLAHDVLEASAKAASEPPHWLGILLLSEDSGTAFPGDDSVRLFTVIDGQQRLTTTILWLAALAHHAKDSGTPIALDVSKFAQLEVQEIDKLPFKVAIEGKWRQSQFGKLLSTRPMQAYAYFRWILHLGNEALLEDEKVTFRQLKPVSEAGTFEEQWDKFLATKKGATIPQGTPIKPGKLEHTTRKEMAVFTLIHDPKVDESQALIFDTLNGMRTPLEPLDHVRNSLFIRLPEEDAKVLYNTQWKDTENAIRRIKMERMSAEKTFLYDYLIARGEKKRQKTINANRGAAHFSVMSKGKTGAALETLITDDLLPAMAAWPIVVRRTDEYQLAGIKQIFHQEALRLMTSIQDLSLNPANPIALHFAAAYGQGSLTQKDLVLALFYTESYLARQLLAGRALSPLRSKIMDVMAQVDGSLQPADLIAALQKSDWPTDPNIRASAATRPAYTDLKSRNILALLRGIERSLGGAGSMFFTFGKGKGEYTVEHIYPQKHDKWLSDLQAWGADTAQMQHLLHSIGNLAAVTSEHNTAVGNGTFQQKKKYPMKPGKAAPLAVNASWTSEQEWTEVEIENRGEYLIEAALQHWAVP